MLVIEISLGGRNVIDLVELEWEEPKRSVKYEGRLDTQLKHEDQYHIFNSLTQNLPFITRMATCINFKLQDTQDW